MELREALVAAEYGFKCSERGENLQQMRARIERIYNPYAQMLDNFLKPFRLPKGKEK